MLWVPRPVQQGQQLQVIVGIIYPYNTNLWSMPHSAKEAPVCITPTWFFWAGSLFIFSSPKQTTDITHVTHIHDVHLKVIMGLKIRHTQNNDLFLGCIRSNAATPFCCNIKSGITQLFNFQLRNENSLIFIFQTLQ